jgi:MFS family permease
MSSYLHDLWVTENIFHISIGYVSCWVPVYRNSTAPTQLMNRDPPEMGKTSDNTLIESSRRARFILVSAVVALSLLGDALLYALLPAKPGEFGVLVWQVGILLGANRLVRLVTNELAGKLVQKRIGNAPLIWAIITGSLITCSYALPIGFWGLLCARILWGACWSLLRVQGYMSALLYSTDKNRGRVFAVYQAVTRVGEGGGLLIGGFLSDLIGIPFTFFVFGACSGCGILLALKAPSSPTLGSRHTTNATNAAASALISRWPLALWVCALCITMSDQMIANLTGRFVAQRIGPQLSLVIGVAGLSGLLLSFRSFTTLLLGPLVGALSDRLGRAPLVIVLIALQSLCIAGIALANSWQLLLACLLVQFASAVSARLMIFAVAGDLAPQQNRAVHMSRFATFVDLGTALGPVVAFAIFAGFGFLYVAAVVWLLLASVAVMILVPLRRMKK